MLDKFMEIAGKIGAQRHLVAIRDAFVAMIPITMIGAVGTLVNNLPIDAYKNFMASIFGDNWTVFGGNVWWAAVCMMSLFLVVGVAYFLAKSYDENGLQAGMIALAIFFIFAPQALTFTPEGATEAISGWGAVPKAYTDTNALFTAIIIGLTSTEMFVRLSRIKQMTIKMPDGVPPEVARSFAKLIPGMLTIAIFTFIAIFINKIADGKYLTDLMNTYLATPISNVADSLGGAILIAFFIHFLWIFGLHGANIALPITETLLMKLGGENATLIEQGATEGFNVMAGPFFDAFVFLGGSGALLGLVIALIIAGKRRKEMVALGGPPACFNISEPLIFGFPIVMNPMFMIPFILAPVICTIVAYLAIDFGMVAPIIVAKIPWVTPPVFGGFMATGSLSGAVLAAVNLVISVVVYLPFVVMSERMEAKKAQKSGN